MPKLNLDETMGALFEPISLTIEGVEYTVGKITAETLKMEPVVDGEDDLTAGGRQLAKMVGVKPTTFDKTDLRIVGQAVKFVSDEITKQMGMPVKNLPAAEGTPLG
jgi:hypothetical protein